MILRILQRPLIAAASPQQLQLRAAGGGAGYARKKLKDYVLPEIRSEDCEQKYISGWGPGGSKVNAAQNAVQLRHLPTNCIVKVHESRQLHRNVDIAFQRLRLTVDRQLHGDKCYEEQFKELQRHFEERTKRARQKRREAMKEAAEEG